MSNNITFGRVVKGSEISTTIELDKPIKSARAGCGVCTRLKYESGKNNIQITYKAVDKRGIWSKGVTVEYMDNSTERITYTVEVVQR